jgi:hypothetical protein
MRREKGDKEKEERAITTIKWEERMLTITSRCSVEPHLVMTH